MRKIEVRASIAKVMETGIGVYLETAGGMFLSDGLGPTGDEPVSFPGLSVLSGRKQLFPVVLLSIEPSQYCCVLWTLQRVWARAWVDCVLVVRGLGVGEGDILPR